jgi:pilus assembly protein Flp/PilA
LIKRFIWKNEGSTGIEYAIVAAIISVGLIGGASAIGNITTPQLQEVSEAMDNAG